MKVQRHFIHVHYAVKNIFNKNILESVSQFTYIDIKISFTRGYIDLSKKTIFEARQTTSFQLVLRLFSNIILYCAINNINEK